MYLCNVKLRETECTDGVLAQLARAFDWQSKGHRFDSVILHKKTVLQVLCKAVFYFFAEKDMTLESIHIIFRIYFFLIFITIQFNL